MQKDYRIMWSCLYCVNNHYFVWCFFYHLTLNIKKRQLSVYKYTFICWLSDCMPLLLHLEIITRGKIGNFQIVPSSKGQNHISGNFLGKKSNLCIFMASSGFFLFLSHSSLLLNLCICVNYYQLSIHRKWNRNSCRHRCCC